MKKMKQKKSKYNQNAAFIIQKEHYLKLFEKAILSLLKNQIFSEDHAIHEQMKYSEVISSGILKDKKIYNLWIKAIPLYSSTGSKGLCQKIAVFLEKRWTGVEDFLGSLGELAKTAQSADLKKAVNTAIVKHEKLLEKKLERLEAQRNEFLQNYLKLFILFSQEYNEKMQRLELAEDAVKKHESCLRETKYELLQEKQKRLVQAQIHSKEMENLEIKLSHVLAAKQQQPIKESKVSTKQIHLETHDQQKTNEIKQYTDTKKAKSKKFKFFNRSRNVKHKTSIMLPNCRESIRNM